MKIMQFHLIKVFCALFFLSVFSCEESGDTPNYVGTWVNLRYEDFFENDLPVNIQTTFIFTESKVEYYVDIEDNNEFSPMGGIKGDLSVSGDEMTITVTSVGLQNGSGELTWVKEGDLLWEAALANYEIDNTTDTWRYKVIANTLTFLSGDFAGLVYTRQ